MSDILVNAPVLLTARLVYTTLMHNVAPHHIIPREPKAHQGQGAGLATQNPTLA